MADALIETPDDDTIDLYDVLKTVVDHLRLLVLTPLLVGLMALGVSFQMAPTYTAKTLFLPPQSQQSSAAALLQSLGSLGGLAGAATGVKNPSDQYLAILRSHTVLDAMIERFDLIRRYEVKLVSEARQVLLKKTKATAGKDGTIGLEVEDQDPKIAADMANTYLEVMRSVMSRLAVTEAQQRRQFFENKLKLAKEELVAAEQALRATGVSATTLKSSPLATVEQVARLKAAITAQEVKISGLRGYLSETAPDFKQAMLELSALRAQLTKAAQDEPANSDLSKHSYIERFREFKYKETLFEMFAKQYEVARIDEAREGALIQVIDTALPPDRKTGPKKALIALMATLGTGMVLLLWVLMRQAWRHASQDEETARKQQQLRESFRRALGLRVNA